MTTESLFHPDFETLRREVLVALGTRPHSARELVVEPSFLRAMEADGLIELDPDRFPDEHVSGNPLVARLPGDKRPWPGWRRWNV